MEDHHVFRMAHPKEFRLLGEALNNCIHGYVRDTVAGRSLIFVYEDSSGKPKAAVQVVTGDNRPYVYQAKINCNKPLTDNPLALERISQIIDEAGIEDRTYGDFGRERNNLAAF
jgi:hypothetical protein